MKIKILIAFWVWRNLAEGVSPFYQALRLRKYKTFNPPSDKAWRGWKLVIWNRAVTYLVRNKKLSFTPALRESF